MVFFLQIILINRRLAIALANALQVVLRIILINSHAEFPAHANVKENLAYDEDINLQFTLWPIDEGAR